MPRVDEHAAAVPPHLLAERHGVGESREPAVRGKLEREPRADLAERLGATRELGDGTRTFDWRKERGDADWGARCRGETG